MVEHRPGFDKKAPGRAGREDEGRAMIENKKKPNPVDTHVGSRVRLRRTMLGMSQEKLGEALGITFQQIQKYEKGSNRIGASRLQRISEVLNVAISFFFEDLPGGAASAGGQPGSQYGSRQRSAYRPGRTYLAEGAPGQRAGCQRQAGQRHAPGRSQPRVRPGQRPLPLD